MTTSNTNIICKNCETLNAPSTIFCGNCGNPIIALKDKSTIQLPHKTPFPPSQSYPQPPIAPIYPVAPKQTFWTRGKIIVLSATILLLLLIIGGGLFSVAYQLGRNSAQGVTPQPTMTANPGTVVSTLTQSPTGTAVSVTLPTATVTTPTPTSTPTKTPVTLKTSPGQSDPIVVTITKFNISTTQLTWNITYFNNTGATQDFFFTKFTLQDSSGNPVDGTGDYISGSNAIINAGQTLQSKAIFPFVPSKGETYQLFASMEVDETYGSTSSSVAFDTVPFTF